MLGHITKKPKNTVQNRKRVGRHHSQGAHYLRAYWPYIPISLIIGLGLFLGNYSPTTRHGVLAYATEMGINTLLSSTNDQREQNGQKPLNLNKELTAAAQAKANDMAARDYWSHNTPDGKEPWVFIQASGYKYLKAGENLAYGFNSSQDTVVGWMHSPTHRENLLDTAYSEVGFGFANAKNYNKSGPETIVVAMYGQPPLAQEAPMTNNNENTSPQNRAVTSHAPITTEPKTLGIARIQTLTKGQLPWATFVIGLMGGLIVTVILLRHGFAFKKLLVEGETFIIHHPWADVMLVAFVMLGYVLTRTSGVIR